MPTLSHAAPQASWRVLRLAWVLVCVVFVSTCDLDKIVGSKADELKKLVIDSTDLILAGPAYITLGGTATIAVSVATGVNVSDLIKRYSSASPSIVAIDSLTGVMTGVAIGTAKVTARVLAPELGEGVSTSQDVRVRYKGIRVTAPAATDSIEGLGQTRLLTVRGLNNANAEIATLVPDSIRSKDSTVITAIAPATVRARKAGSAYVVTIYDSLRDSVLVRVRRVAKSVAFPDTLYTARHVNFDLPLTVTVKDVADSVITPAPIAWRVADTTVATVGSATGILRLKRVDTTRVFARIDSVERAQRIVVSQVTASLTKSAAGTLPDTVARNVNVPPSIVARDSGLTPIAKAKVTFRLLPAAQSQNGAAITDSVKETDANGRATLGSWKLRDSSGVNAVEVTVEVPLRTSRDTIRVTSVPGRPRRLRYAVQPSSGPLSAPINPAISLSVVDSLDNVVTSDTSQIILALGANPGKASLSGDTTKKAVGGVATFDSVRVSAGGSGYTLVARAGALDSATSNGFAAFGARNKLTLISPQPSPTATVPIIPAIRIAVQDSNGITVTTASDTVSLDFAGPASTSLGGQKKRAAQAGVATFDSLVFDQPGNNNQFKASIPGLPQMPVGAPFTVAAVGPPRRLAFTAQPSNATAGAAISPAIQVTIRDSAGATVTSAADSITLRVDPSTNPSGSRISGGQTLKAKAVAGVVVFSTVNLDKSGTGYRLSATAGALSAATSTAFNVTPGVATRLKFVQQPTHTVADDSITPNVKVAVQDAFTNTATSVSSGTMTLSLIACTSNVLGTLTRSIANGEAVFAGLRPTIQATGCKLRAEANSQGLSPDTSTAFNVESSAGAVALGFVAEPSSSRKAAEPWGSIRVAVQTASGVTVPSAPQTQITLSLSANPGGDTLSGPTTATTSNGVATFSGNSLKRAAAGYVVSASAIGFKVASGSPFAIEPVAAATVAFVDQPTTGPAGLPFSPVIRVAVRDAFANVVKSDTTRVTLKFDTSGTGGGSFASGDSASVISQAGIATFNGLRVRRAASAYRLRATASSLTATVSNPFDIVRGPLSQLGFSPQPDSIYPLGSLITVAVQTRDSAGNVVADPSGPVTLQKSGGPSAAALSGKTQRTPVSGTATFDSLLIDLPGSGYTLRACKEITA